MVARKRSITISGHRTSFSLEAPFLECLQDLAELDGMSLSALVVKIDHDRPRDSNLSSALRIHVLEQARIGRLNISKNESQ